MLQKYFKLRPLPLVVVVAKLKTLLMYYKLTEETKTAKEFDIIFHNTCKKYYLTRAELYNKVLGR